MKQLILMLGVVFSLSAVADEKLVCTQYGYTPNPENFHDIKVEHIDPYVFTITKERVVTQIGRVYEVVDPSTVGFEDLDIVAYANRYAHEVLYLYKNGDKTEIGISTLIDDSDAFYGDKALYSGCNIEEPPVHTAQMVNTNDWVHNPVQQVSYTF
ncbi:hypothetical protein D3C81_304820 [compost metagenome]